MNLLKKLLLAAAATVALSGHALAAPDASSPWTGLSIQGREQAWRRTTTNASDCASYQSEACGVGYLQGVVLGDPITGYALGTPTNPLSVTPGPGTQFNTYTSNSGIITPPSTPTDIWTISASATKTIWVTAVRVTGQQTTTGSVIISLIKRSTLDTGGSFGSTPNTAPHNSASPASTAVLARYTANPTATGTSAGTIRSVYAQVTAAADWPRLDLNWEFNGGASGGPLVLTAGSTEELAISLSSVTVTGGTFIVQVDYLEF